MATRVQEPAPVLEASLWTRHRGPVTGAVPIPGARTAVTSGYDGAVGLFDLDTGRAELLGYHDHLVNRIVVDADGRRAASCSSDYTVGLWNLETRTREATLRGHEDDVEDFAFADAETGVSASRDRRILVWDLRSGTVLRVLAGHEKDVLALAVEAGRVYSSGDDRTLRVWDLATGAELLTLGPFEDETDTCAIDPGRGRAVLGCDDGCLRVFDTRTGALQRVLRAHRSGIKKVDVSRATGDVLSAAYDQRIYVWDAETFERRASLERRPSTWERSLTWSRDGAQIFGGTFDGTVLAWDAATGALAGEAGRDADHPGNPCFNEVAASPGGDLVLVSDDGFVRLARLTPTESQWLGRFEPRSGRALMNAVTADWAAGLVVCGAHDHVLHVFRQAADGRGLGREVEVPLGRGPINSLRILRRPNGAAEIFAACYSGAIVRVSPEGQVLGEILVHQGAVKSLRLLPEESLGVSCGADGLLLLWRFSGELCRRYVGHTAIINDVDLSPGGTRLSSVSRDFSLKVFDVASGRLECSVPIGRRSLKSVCFWDEGRVLVGDYWGGLIAVDLRSGTHRRAVVAANGISALARSGEHVVACSYDGTVSLVRPDLTVVRTLRAMRQRLGDPVIGAS